MTKKAEKKEIKVNVKEMKAILKDAGISYPADSEKVETYFKNQLEGASKTLEANGMKPSVLGFSNLQILATAKTLNEVKAKESLQAKREKARKTKETLKAVFKDEVLKNMVSIGQYFSSVIGISPSKSISSKSIGLFDGSNIGVSLTAIKKNPDDEANKRLKETARILTDNLSTIVMNKGLKRTADLMKLEAGTKEQKALSLFPTDPTKAGCLHDDMYIYQVSLKYMSNETE